MRNTVSVLLLGDAGNLARRRPFTAPSPSAEKPPGPRLSSLDGDEIRYFVKVISPGKVSFRQVIASAPFPPTAVALRVSREHASERARIRGGRGSEVREGPIPPPPPPSPPALSPSRRQNGWRRRKEIPHFGLRRWRTEG